MKINETCEACLLGKHLNKYPSDASPDKVKAYQNEIKELVEKNKDLSAPEMAAEIENIYFNYFNEKQDFAEDKKYFNGLMLSLEEEMIRSVEEADDHLLRAVQYAMIGNFIDFGAMKNVDSDKLREFLDEAYKTEVDKDVLESFRKEISTSKRLVYFTDNCGEIVADKVLIRTLRKLNPSLYITAIVRGKPVFNDATMEDAIQVRLSDVADEVIGNGTDIPGTVLNKVSDETVNAVNNAELFVSKGQGNYESLSDTGLNIYYIFMCKCSRFVDKFKKPLYSGMITKELE